MTAPTTSVARWVCDHWIATWFAERHTGTPGHSPEQCRAHVRYWIATRRSEYGS